MRLTEFWSRMHAQFGLLTDTFAADHVLALLGQRTVREALAAGMGAKDVWRAVCEEMEVPAGRT